MSVGVYDKQGLIFQYPENWQVQDEQLGDWPRAVSVEAPDGSFWSLKVFEHSQPPEELAAETLRAMRQEYEDLESAPVEEAIGEYRAVGHNMDFYCLDLVIVCQVRAFTTEFGTVLLHYQGEDRDFQQLQPVFAAITASLLGLGAAQRG